MTSPLLLPDGATVHVEPALPGVTVDTPDVTTHAALTMPIVHAAPPQPTGPIVIPVVGQQGPPGVDSNTITRTTAYALSGHRAVTADDAGLAIYATSDDLDHVSRPVWLTTGAWDAAVLAALTTEGDVTEPSWNWTPGLPIWLGINGVLTQSIPGGAVFVREVAEVVDSQTIQFKPQLPIVKG